MTAVVLNAPVVLPAVAAAATILAAAFYAADAWADRRHPRDTRAMGAWRAYQAASRRGGEGR